ncbi:MAG: TIGR04500 family putative peptide maturation system protein [Polyangiaceae bacterium]|nr:TIGR04500 family putative peptide maturation system protein [Polyangiaceae bacterium]
MKVTDLAGLAAKGATTLVALAEAGADPAAAAAAAKELGRALPGASVRLLWEAQPAARLWHYDFLIELEGGGVLSLGYVAPGGTPFALRAAQRVSDRVLLRVNGRDLHVDVAMTCLDFIWERQAVMDELISRMIVQEWIDRLDIKVEGDELQEAMDAWRRRRGLFRAADTRAHLDRVGMTLLKLESMLRDEVAGRKLRDRLTADGVAAAFAADPASFRRARVSWITVREEDAARLDGVTTPADLFAVADDLSRSGRVGAARFFEEPRSLPPLLAEAVPAALKRGGGAGAIRADGIVYAYHAAHDEPASPPALDEPAVERVKDHLFAEWLAARRAEAKIEWFWGQE